MSSSLLRFFELGFLGTVAAAYVLSAACCWVDARRRYLSRGPAHGVLALALLLPLLGAAVYLLVRPGLTWRERRYKRHYLALLEQLSGTSGEESHPEESPAAVSPGLAAPEPAPA